MGLGLRFSELRGDFGAALAVKGLQPGLRVEGTWKAAAGLRRIEGLVLGPRRDYFLFRRRCLLHCNTTLRNY